jgi:OOP family OmpA-OmpF porin
VLTKPFFAAALAVAPSAYAGEAAPHPMFQPVPSFEPTEFNDETFGTYEFLINDNDRKRQEGHHLSATYNCGCDESRYSTVQILRNHEGAVRALGGRTVYKNEGQGYATFVVPSDAGDTWVHVEAAISGMYYTIESIQIASMKQEISAKALADALARDGRVAVYDILFDTGKATLRAESDWALAATAELLKTNRALSLHVVGHTDNTGNVAANLTLSEQRAKAVVSALVSKHGIDTARLSAHGVGPLAPVASNATEGGQQKNRRVELVAREGHSLPSSAPGR